MFEKASPHIGHHCSLKVANALFATAPPVLGRWGISLFRPLQKSHHTINMRSTVGDVMVQVIRKGPQAGPLLVLPEPTFL
jgi:hypothetical protein